MCHFSSSQWLVLAWITVSASHQFSLPPCLSNSNWFCASKSDLSEMLIWLCHSLLKSFSGSPGSSIQAPVFSLKGLPITWPFSVYIDPFFIHLCLSFPPPPPHAYEHGTLASETALLFSIYFFVFIQDWAGKISSRENSIITLLPY